MKRIDISEGSCLIWTFHEWEPEDTAYWYVIDVSDEEFENLQRLKEAFNEYQDLLSKLTDREHVFPDEHERARRPPHRSK